MRALIVDDEKPAREELKWLLEESDVEVVGQASSAEEALTFVRRESVDAVFLDIDMPGIGGMRLAELLSEDGLAPAVVFVTAYEHHALDAFAVDAVDYLLKPVRLERLQRTLERVRKRSQSSAPRRKHLDRISVQHNGVYRVIPAKDIAFFESEDGVVVVQTRDHGRTITDFSLKFLEENLDEDLFFRSHRSYIVRLDAIESIAPWGAGTYRLILDRDSDTGVPLARSRASELKSLIPWSAHVFDDS